MGDVRPFLILDAWATIAVRLLDVLLPWPRPRRRRYMLMKQYNARVEVALDGATEDQAAQIGAALRPLQPSVESTDDGSVEVHVVVAAETLMEATISAVSGVWTATGGEPVAVDIARDGVAEEERSGGESG